MFGELFIFTFKLTWVIFSDIGVPGASNDRNKQFSYKCLDYRIDSNHFSSNEGLGSGIFFETSPFFKVISEHVFQNCFILGVVINGWNSLNTWININFDLSDSFFNFDKQILKGRSRINIKQLILLKRETHRNQFSFRNVIN